MKHLGDISKINGAEIEPVDVISFGSPCQDLSVAGKRAGLKHEANGDEETTRSGLFMEAVRIIKEMRDATNGKYPRVALWENVPGAFSSNKGEDFRVVLEELIKIVEPTATMPEVPKSGWPYADSYCGNGWSIAYRVLDAQYIRTAQRRRRVFLVLDLGGECAREILFERESLRGHFAEGGAPWESLATYAEGCSGVHDSSVDEKADVPLVCMATQQGGAEIRTDDKAPTITAAAGMSGNNQPFIAFAQNQRDEIRDLGDKSGAIQAQPGMKQQTVIIDSVGGNAEAAWEGEKTHALRATHYKMPICVASEAAGFCTEHSAQSRGIGYEEEVSPTLRAGVTPAVCVKEVLPFDTTQVTSPQNGNNPKWGDPCHPLAAQGHSPAVCVKTYDARGNGDGDIVGTVTGDHERRVTDYTSVVVEPVYCLQGNGIDRADTAGCNGKGWTEEVCYTLNTIDRPAVVMSLLGDEVAGTLKARDYKGVGRQDSLGSAVCLAYGMDRASFNQGQNAKYDFSIIPEQQPTMTARGPGAVCYWDGSQTCGTLTANNAGGNQRMPDKENFNCVVEEREMRYIVRRLTPTECARLQGFPDWWGHIGEKESFTEEEYNFWLDVRNTHAEINGKQVKEYTEAQMLTWYNKLHTDSAEYKMWGNGIALPPALYCMQGIAEAIK